MLHILTIRPRDATRGDGSGAQLVHEAIEYAPAEVIFKLLECNRNTPGVKKAAEVQLPYTTYSNSGKTAYHHTNGSMLVDLAVGRVDVLETVLSYNPQVVEQRSPLKLALRMDCPSNV